MSTTGEKVHLALSDEYSNSNSEEIESVLMLLPGFDEKLPDFLVSVAEAFFIRPGDFTTRRSERAVGIEREERPVHTASIHVGEQVFNVTASELVVPREYVRFTIYDHGVIRCDWPLAFAGGRRRYRYNASPSKTGRSKANGLQRSDS